MFALSKETFWIRIFLNFSGNFRVHPMATNPAPEQQVETLRREGEHEHLSKSFPQKKANNQYSYHITFKGEWFSQLILSLRGCVGYLLITG